MNLDLQSKQSLKGSFQNRANPLFLSALRSRNFSAQAPVWIMRQAGRCLPSYQALRERYSLNEMFYSPELIEKVTALPVDELRVDAAILFADILHVALPLGFKVEFPKKGGPTVFPTIHHRQEIGKLITRPVEECLGCVTEGITRLKQRLDKPLIGFCADPFTVAYYLTGKNIKPWLYCDPEGLHVLLERIAQATLIYLKLQVEAGVDALQIFASHASLLSKSQFDAFVVPYLKRILHAFPATAITLFCRNSSLFIDQLVALRPQAIGVDSSDSLVNFRKRIPQSIAIQGNFDPDLLYAPPHIIEKQVREALRPMAKDPGLIVNLGHGIRPDTPLDNVRAFINAVRGRSSN